MKRAGRLSSAVLLAMALAGAIPAQGSGAQRRGAPSSRLVAGAVRAAYAAFAKGRFVPGMAIAVAYPTPSGRTLRVQTFRFGYADVSRRRRVADTTRFEIGSETKVFTAALLARAVELGSVSLDAKVQSKLPAGVTAPSKCGRTFTFAELATHRSGLLRLPFNYGPTPSDHAHYTPELLWQGLQAPGALQYCPGSHWVYSNFGFGLLGTVLARVERSTFGRLVAAQITGRLGMGDTGLERETPRLAVGYCPNHDVAPRWDNIEALAGGGGLISSIRDMGRFVLAQLGQGPTAVVRVLRATQRPIAEGKTSSWHMGLAWQIYNKPGIPGRYLYKNGGTSGMHSATVVLPSARIGVTVLSNGPDDPSPVSAAIVRQLFGVPSLPTPGDGDAAAGGC